MTDVQDIMRTVDSCTSIDRPCEQRLRNHACPDQSSRSAPLLFTILRRRRAACSCGNAESTSPIACDKTITCFAKLYRDIRHVKTEPRLTSREAHPQRTQGRRLHENLLDTTLVGYRNAGVPTRMRTGQLSDPGSCVNRQRGVGASASRFPHKRSNSDGSRPALGSVSERPPRLQRPRSAGANSADAETGCTGRVRPETTTSARGCGARGS
jgi:hypothetical protein